MTKGWMPRHRPGPLWHSFSTISLSRFETLRFELARTHGSGDPRWTPTCAPSVDKLVSTRTAAPITDDAAWPCRRRNTRRNGYG
jgi:hypothetical protein